MIELTDRGCFYITNSDDQMKFYESKEFQQMNRKWKKKLKASGFKDIERSEHQLRVYSYQVYDSYDPAVADYYVKAEAFLLNHKFENEFDKIIWELHSQGQSVRKIQSHFEKKGGISSKSKREALGLQKKGENLTPSKTVIHDRITKLERVMLESSAE